MIEKKRGGKTWKIQEYRAYKRLATNIEFNNFSPDQVMANLILYIKEKGYEIKLNEDDYSATINLPQIMKKPTLDEADEEENDDEESQQTISVVLFKKAGEEGIFLLDFQKDNVDFFTMTQFFGDIYKAHYGVELIAS